MKSTANISWKIHLIFTITALWLKGTIHTNRKLHKIHSSTFGIKTTWPDVTSQIMGDTPRGPNIGDVSPCSITIDAPLSSLFVICLFSCECVLLAYFHVMNKAMTVKVISLPMLYRAYGRDKSIRCLAPSRRCATMTRRCRARLPMSFPTIIRTKSYLAVRCRRKVPVYTVTKPTCRLTCNWVRSKMETKNKKKSFPFLWFLSR